MVHPTHWLRLAANGHRRRVHVGSDDVAAEVSQADVALVGDRRGNIDAVHHGQSPRAEHAQHFADQPPVVLEEYGIIGAIPHVSGAVGVRVET